MASVPLRRTARTVVAWMERLALMVQRAESGIGMGLGVGIAEMSFGDVGIDLGGRETGMAEQLLHDPEVGAAFEQVASEGVAKGVRGHALAETGLVQIPGHGHVEHADAEPSP